MTDQQATELYQPLVGAFDDPAPFEATQFPPIPLAPLLVLPVGSDQLDPAPFPSLPTLVGVVATVCKPVSLGDRIDNWRSPGSAAGTNSLPPIWFNGCMRGKV